MSATAAPEPHGPRWAYCRHCGEQIGREAPRKPWFHLDPDTRACQPGQEDTR